MSGTQIEFLLSLAALAAVLPVGAAVYVASPAAGLSRNSDVRVPGYWILLAVAVAGPVAFAAWLAAGGWPRGISGALWVTVAATALVMLWVSLRFASGWRLAVLASPVMAVLGALAVIWRQAGPVGGAGKALGLWSAAHVMVSVLTYALVTMAAVAALAVLIKVRALRRKQGNRLAARLPAIADSERIQLLLLRAAAVVLGAGILTGLALEFGLSGNSIILNHKYLLSLVGFVVICALIFANARSGVRGRQAARTALVAWVLLTLGYLGVKFVTDVVLT